jgi:hypothetical protein
MMIALGQIAVIRDESPSTEDKAAGKFMKPCRKPSKIQAFRVVVSIARDPRLGIT